MDDVGSQRDNMRGNGLDVHQGSTPRLKTSRSSKTSNAVQSESVPTEALERCSHLNASRLGRHGDFRAELYSGSEPYMGKSARTKVRDPHRSSSSKVGHDPCTRAGTRSKANDIGIHLKTINGVKVLVRNWGACVANVVETDIWQDMVGTA